ncbi:protein kinase [Lentisphaera marina]|uniref:protein kinase domain-containing protein n=1 Tax=Lentisphaera marina TaxID=1111041 RepID=UPI00236509AB|nr:protein kinase [Lentisphaera marina]MDD7984255.1 protein kinase [Lentisphaera marina]
MSDQVSKPALPEGSKIFCPACNAKLDVSGLIIDSKFYCPGCNAKIQVPEESLTLQSNKVAKPETQETAPSEPVKSLAHKALGAAVKLPGQKTQAPAQASTEDEEAGSSYDIAKRIAAAKQRVLDSTSPDKKNEADTETNELEDKIAAAKQRILNATAKDKVDVNAAATIQDKVPSDIGKTEDAKSDNPKQEEVKEEKTEPTKTESTEKKEEIIAEPTEKKEEVIAEPTEEQIAASSTAPETESSNGLNKVKCHACSALNDFSSKQSFEKVPCGNCSEIIIVPKRFQHFLLEDLLSEGDIATVYRALDLSLNREVCVKIFNKEISSNKALVDTLIEKLSLSATLTQQNIVPIYTSGTHEEQFFIVSQYMNQQSLENFIAKANGSLPINACLKTLHEVSKGLLEYSRHKQFHHHLTPRNILINSDGQIKVTDFNIFYSIMRSLDKKEMYGTEFVSPEIIRKGQDIDSSGDVFHLGLIAQQLVTGKLPYSAKDQSELMDKHLDDTPKSLSELRRDTPQELCDFVQKMLSVRPGERPSLSEVEKEFDKLRNPQQANMSATRMKTPVSKAPLEKDADKFKHAKLQDTDMAHEDLLIELEDRPKKAPLIPIVLVLILIIGIAGFALSKKADSDSVEEESSKEVPTELTNTSVVVEAENVTNGDEEATENEAPKQEEAPVVEAIEETPVVEVTPEETAPVVEAEPKPETAMENFDEAFAEFSPSPVNKEQRPYPSNLDFSPTISEFIDYLNSQPDSQRKAIEHERLRLLNRIRFYLIKVLANSPYVGKVYSREFEDSIDGFLEVKNDQLLMGRNGAAFTLEIDVTQLEDVQFAKILEFFASSKLDQVTDSPDSIAKTLQESAAEDYFKAALLMEWFKNEQAAKDYLKIATELNPRLANHYKVFFDGQE